MNTNELTPENMWGLILVALFVVAMIIAIRKDRKDHSEMSALTRYNQTKKAERISKIKKLTDQNKIEYTSFKYEVYYDPAHPKGDQTVIFPN
ncbi:hypothetical protein [Sunxiuqinia indica]|uniref:hypothetical protein n=1 Tax=Sunxiuqinia indica TaxID=2692584 RepID=UPI00135C04BC|nr:hypothetical protein [Sunxiuqinia indica]